MAYNNKMDENVWLFTIKPNGLKIHEMLSDQPAWYSDNAKMMSEYTGYVIPFARSKDGPWRLYTTVAGKIAILHDAHMVDGKPQPIQEEVDLDYRGNLVVVKGTMTSPIFGTVFEAGTGVMGEGASGADRTNPIENAMTSWRGRAASALCGAGILPYTGIASAEEVTSAQHRDEMADKGYRVVTPDTAAADSGPSKSMLAAFTSTKKILEWGTDAEAESALAEYLSAIGSAYDGTATDFVLHQPSNSIFAKIIQFHKDKK